MDRHPADRVSRRERLHGRVITLPARDHGNAASALGQRKRQIGQHLARGRVVRVEEPVE